MKGKSFKKPPPIDPDPGPEEWITREQIRELYPHITDRTLRTWRDNRQVYYQTDNPPTTYKPSDIRAQVEYFSRPKKRTRYQYVAKKLADIDRGVLVLILGLGLAFAYYDPWDKSKTYSAWEFWLPIAGILFFAAVYWIVKGVGYLYRRFFRRGKSS